MHTHWKVENANLKFSQLSRLCRNWTFVNEKRKICSVTFETFNNTGIHTNPSKLCEHDFLRYSKSVRRNGAQVFEVSWETSADQELSEVNIAQVDFLWKYDAF